ncbi:MAG: hypothetical protein K8S18_01955 [Desulfobacula sp.]|nr:hypothetical protein [Desulfobacula sp.]
MSQVIRIPLSLYKRLESHAQGFQTPGDVIAKILDAYEKNQTDNISPGIPKITNRLPSKHLEIIFYPPNDARFKELLLERREAWVALYKTDGSCEVNKWNANRFSESSSVKGNLQSGYLRNWRDKGIIKAEIAIDKDEITSHASVGGRVKNSGELKTRYHNINLITQDLGYQQLGSSTVFQKDEQYIISPAVAEGENGQYWIDIRQTNLDKVDFDKCDFLIRIVPNLFCCCPLIKIDSLIDQHLMDNRPNSGDVWGIKLGINLIDKIAIARSNRDQDINIELELLDASDVIDYFDKNSFTTRL